jgi:hypothetical protein
VKGLGSAAKKVNQRSPAKRRGRSEKKVSVGRGARPLASYRPQVRMSGKIFPTLRLASRRVFEQIAGDLSKSVD